MPEALYILGELSDGDVEWMIRTGGKQRYNANTTLIQQGERVEGLYLLIEGQLAVIDKGEASIVIAHLGQGEMVGEMSFVEKRLPSVSVIVSKPSLIMMIPHDALSARLASHIDFAARFYRALTLLLSHRLRGTTIQLGHGTGAALVSKNDDPDELSPGMLDNVFLAGTRFENIMKRLKES